MDTGRFEQSLRVAFLAGKAKWPAIRCSEHRFRDWARRNDISADRLDDHAVDLYLACACVFADPSAIATFDRLYLTRTSPLISAVTLTNDDLAELRQQLRVKLLVGDSAKIGLYRGQGTLAAWVQVCATRTALNLKRGRLNQALAGTTPIESLVSQEPNAETLMAAIQNRNALNAALARCLCALTSKEKTLLARFFVDEMNIDQIGVMFDVHRATIARWLAVIRSKILAQVCQKMSADLRASRSEVLSLMGLARSDIDINVGTILAVPTAGQVEMAA